MKEIFGSFRVEEDYTWRDDIMTVTRRIIDEIDDARLTNIAAHFDVDLSEIREFLDAKRRKHLAPMTNADKLRSMSDEDLAVEATVHGGCPHNCETPDDMDTDCVKCWHDWLRKEAPDETD